MDWFSSDHHFGHKNIIQFCKRPFKDVAHMERELIEIWNSIVMPDDTIYYLGDFSFYPPAMIANVVAQLNGYKILVAGNHDRSKSKMVECGFDEAHNSLEYRGYKLIHNPKEDLHTPMLCGHVHQEWLKRGNAVNVGVDMWDYRPVSFEQLMEV